MRLGAFVGDEHLVAPAGQGAQRHAVEGNVRTGGVGESLTAIVQRRNVSGGTVVTVLEWSGVR